jgi:hypothetical protein
VRWLNEPGHWSHDDGVLTVTADGGTDFWRTTGYGFIRDSGHLYGDEISGDFDLTLRVRGGYATQFDQAGAMLRADERHWVKTGIEFVDGRPRFSTVITAEHSNWSLADLPVPAAELTLALTRRGDAVEIRYGAGDAEPALAAVVYLPPDRPLLAGAMCAAPEGQGFEVSFRDLRLTPRSGA